MGYGLNDIAGYGEACYRFISLSIVLVIDKYLE